MQISEKESKFQVLIGSFILRADIKIILFTSSSVSGFAKINFSSLLNVPLDKLTRVMYNTFRKF